MLALRAGALCGAGRGVGRRTAEVRLFADRRSEGRVTDLAINGFFAFAALLLVTRLTGRLPFVGFLPDPFVDFFLAMMRFPVPSLLRRLLSHEARRLLQPDHHLPCT